MFEIIVFGIIILELELIAWQQAGFLSCCRIDWPDHGTRGSTDAPYHRISTRPS
jgi:hypothetical protein